MGMTIRRHWKTFVLVATGCILLLAVAGFVIYGQLSDKQPKDFDGTFVKCGVLEQEAAL